MSVISQRMGHKIYSCKEDWRYVDNSEIADIDNPRPCIKCGKEITIEGHDPCIANLPGVKYACCGHGIQESYVFYINGSLFRDGIQQKIGTMK